MSSFRQIEANRRNARLSTGPVTDEGKKRSRKNALRHGLSSETVIEALEDADDFASFQMAITTDYDAQSAVERELVLRLASLLWRLRRASAIETGLFQMQARQLSLFRKQRQAQAHRDRRDSLRAIDEGAIAFMQQEATDHQDDREGELDASSHATPDAAFPSDDITRSFVHLNDLPSCPLDRLSRYEGALWRQACQILFTLQFLNRRKPWERARFRDR